MRKNTTFILGTRTFVILVVLHLFGCHSDTVVELENNKGVPVEEKVEKEDLPGYQQVSSATYQVQSLSIPENANFAGEQVPVENVSVKESLDRELLSNTYWHSNTFFYIKRASRWFPSIEPILKKHEIPEDFKYLAVIESGLLNVTSPAGAKGYWQFMKSTAKDYGLEVNNFVDERYHVEKSTEAACQYLKNAYNKFDNWTLAAASYNMGKSGLSNRLTQQKVSSYYDLLLNSETARYVYRIVAVKYILSDPQQYGFNVHQEDLYPPYETYKLEMDSSISDLVTFAIAQKTTYKTLKLLNPWLIAKSLPNPNNKKYTILMPVPNTGLDRVTKPSN